MRTKENRNMRTLVLLLVGIGLLLGAGCKSFGPSDAQTAALVTVNKDQVTQARSFVMFELLGTAEKPATWNVSAEKIRMSAPVPPIMPAAANDRQCSMIERIATETARLGMFAAGAYLLRDALGTEKTVVKEVPAAP